MCEKRLEIRLTSEELEKIKKNALKVDKEYHAFVRCSAIDMCVIVLNHDVVTEHNEQISAYRNTINQLVFTIIKIANYFPADLEYILEETKLLLKCEKTVLKISIKDFDENRKKF